MDGESHTELTSILHTDPKGLIPPFLINQMVTRGCDNIADMVKFMVKEAGAE